MEMKHAAMFAATMSLGISQANAQSNVLLYGLVTTAVTYVNNAGGHSAVQLSPAGLQNNRWGLRGTEDLGGGNRALFALESGFNIDDGKSGQGGRLFGRQAFVGLGSNSLGQITFGRQYDSIYDYLDFYSAPVAASGIAAHVGDNDNAFGTFRHNNTIKYVTPELGGFRATATYSLSDSSQSANNRSYSFGASYQTNNFVLSGAFMRLDNPGLLSSKNPNGAVTDDYFGAPFLLFRTSPLNTNAGVSMHRVGGVAASYSLGATRFTAETTQVRYKYADGTGLRLGNYDVSVAHHLTSSLVLGAAYVYTDGRYDGLDSKPSWHMGQLSIDYFFSKRTDVFLYGVYQLAHSAKASIYSVLPSSDKEQILVSAGIRHKF